MRDFAMTRRCTLCRTPLGEGFTGRYCSHCRPERGNDFTRNVLRLHGTIAHIADQRAQGARWRDIAVALHYPRQPERFAAYVLGTTGVERMGQLR
jgi:hypothetical protein